MRTSFFCLARLKYYSAAVMYFLICIFCENVDAASYGTLCNFDTVNTTGEECHGFEIELEDLDSADVTRTFNWNHYGVPRVFNDDSDPQHRKCIIRWEAQRMPDGSWSAYTAIPSEPISPTNGHQFTNPSVNFGGEHFGVSYRKAPAIVRYFWLVDRGGLLVRGPEEVKISTPTFTYNPPVNGMPGRVVAEIEPPEPAEIHRDEFGPATWVRSIKTTTHSNRKIKLRDLRSDDPGNDEDENWSNGEAAEIEIEWELLQEEFGKDGEGKGDVLEGEPEDLPGGDEVITRRWEFYEYTGPFDPENGEALADKVAPDGIHGVGTREINGQDRDLAEFVVVGEYLGAQMAAFDAAPGLDLTDFIQDGVQGQPYPDRVIVSGGTPPVTSKLSGDLPDGLSFNPVSGILSGMPLQAGEYEFTVECSDAGIVALSRRYSLRVAAPDAKLNPRVQIDVDVFPAGAGEVDGAGGFDPGSAVNLGASPAEGYRFARWTEMGRTVSSSHQYALTADVNHILVANFEPVISIHRLPEGLLQLDWPVSTGNWKLLQSEYIDPASWNPYTKQTTEIDGKQQITVNPALDGQNSTYFRLQKP